MKKINVVLNSKGGVGKSTIAILLAVTAAYRGLDFEYIEIDDSNNTSESFAKSETLKGKMTSVKADKAQEELYKATFKAIKQDKIVIVDIGGGNESKNIVKLLKDEFQHVDINYILPMENSYKQMSNLVDTFNNIDDNANTYLVKNKMIIHKNGELDDYIFFEGDKPLDVKSIREELKLVNKVFEIYLSNIIQIAEITQESILDLAELAIEYTPAEASKIFMEDCDIEDINNYNKLMIKYSKSEKALNEIIKVSAEFEELFNE